MKKKLLIGIFCLCIAHAAFAQKKPKDPDYRDEGAVNLYNNTLPALLQGNIFENALTNSVTLNAKDQAIEFAGIAYAGDSNRNSFRVKLSASAENNIAAIFSENKVVPKVSGNISYNSVFKSWISYDKTKESQLIKYPVSERYNILDQNPEEYGSIRKNTWLFNTGITFSGAKYFLIDTLKPDLNSMVYSRKFSGWETYAQGSWVVYNYKRKHLLYYTLRAGYGEVNNIGDLTEHSITLTRSYTASAGTNKNVFERKITGFFDSYQVQHRGTISVEIGYMPKWKSNQIGFLFGGDIIYNEKNKNNYTINLGTNIPVMKKGDDTKPLLFVSAIVASNDPFNMNNIDDFQLGKSIDIYLRIGLPINLPENSSK